MPAKGATAIRRQGAHIAAAALAATAIATAMATATTATVRPQIELEALITPANSTAQVFAGSTYYGTNWNNAGYGHQQIVPFFLGPPGITDAIDRNAVDGERIVVLSSGWGAGQTGTALARMQKNDDPALDNIDLVVFDNNSNRASGGFWTTYAPFAPLLRTSAAPSPDDLPVRTIDVSYEYNINSNAVTYPLNLLATANSLVAYLYNYGGQERAKVPIADLEPGTSYVLDGRGDVISQNALPEGKTTSYVMVKSNGLPLVRPLRMLPGGYLIADAIEPVLTVLVNWGYKDNDPIAADPTTTRPMGILPSAKETRTALNALPGAVRQGLDALKDDLSALAGRKPAAPVTTAKSELAGAAAPAEDDPVQTEKVSTSTSSTSASHPKPKLATSRNEAAPVASSTQKDGDSAPVPKKKRSRVTDAAPPPADSVAEPASHKQSGADTGAGSPSAPSVRAPGDKAEKESAPTGSVS